MHHWRIFLPSDQAAQQAMPAKVLTRQKETVHQMLKNWQKQGLVEHLGNWVITRNWKTRIN